MLQKEYLIIDSNYYCHKAKHALHKESLITMDSRYVEIIFVFLKQIFALVNETQCSNILFCWDSVHSKRKKLFPGYKLRDGKTKEEIELDNICHPQFKELRQNILPSLGFNNIYIRRGLEADDIFAALTSQFNKTKFIIATVDKDIYQLLSKRVCLVSKVNKQYLYFTEDNFLIKYDGFPPKDWWKVKAIAGCSSDMVPGIKGIGEKFAIQYLLKTLKEKSKAFQKIEKFYGNSDYKRNVRLVKLPFQKMREFVIEKDCLTIPKFIKTFKKLEFNSMLDAAYLQKLQNMFGV